MLVGQSVAAVRATRSAIRVVFQRAGVSAQVTKRRPVTVAVGRDVWDLHSVIEDPVVVCMWYPHHVEPVNRAVTNHLCTMLALKMLSMVLSCVNRKGKMCTILSTYHA